MDIAVRQYGIASVERDGLRQALAAAKAQVAFMREALQWIAQQSCTNKDIDCAETSLCITEYCLPCYATSALGIAGRCESLCALPGQELPGHDRGGDND